MCCQTNGENNIWFCLACYHWCYMLSTPVAMKIRAPVQGFQVFPSELPVPCTSGQVFSLL